ncbi:MAG: hypothetical protein KIS66_08475 [Fimbriimonadaceae bacterium]|nr:hypothetical protein [Fimbriimonadaceae bacterium]
MNAKLVRRFRDAEAQVAAWKQAQAQGGLTAESFAASVATLRIEDEQGGVWQPSPETGDWLRWDGTQWLADSPFADDFDRLADRYRALRDLHRQGKLPDPAFGEAVGQLRLREADGAEWAIKPDDGAWVRWDGAAWQPAEPPTTGADGRAAVAPSMYGDLEQAYRESHDALSQGAMTPEAFAERVGKLRVTDEAGAWWQINPETGGWVRWNGQAWIPAEPPREEVSSVGPARKFAASVAESAKEEFKSTVKSVPAMVFRMIVSRAIMMAVAYFGSIYLHAYWTGYKNDGFRDDGGPWAPWLYLTQSTHGNSYAFIWGIGGMLLSSVVMTVLSRGPIKGILGAVTAPLQILARVKDSGKLGIAALALGAGAALFASARLSINPQANLSLGIGLLFVAAGRPGYYVARFLSGVVRRVAAPHLQAVQGRLPFDMRVAQLAMMGVAPGFYLASRFPADKVQVAGIALIAVGVGVVMSSRKPKATPETVATLLLCAFFGSVLTILLDMLFCRHVLADDYGRDEFSGNPDDYWKTEGHKLVDHSKPAGNAAGVGAAGGDDLVPPDEPKEPPDEYTFSLCLDAYTMTLTGPNNEDVRAWVVVSGKDGAECARLEASLNPQIGMSVTGPIAEWFAAETRGDSGGSTCSFTITVPDDPAQRKGPTFAYVVARVGTPKGTLTARCRIDVQVSGDHFLWLNPEELKVKANESDSAIYAWVEVKDESLTGEEQLAKTRALAPRIKFKVEGDQASWVGGPGPVEGYLVADGKQIPVKPILPKEDLAKSPPFFAEVEASCDVPKVGTLSKGGRILIDPPDWFIEVQVVKASLTVDMKDRAEYRVRLIPMDQSYLGHYTGSDPDALNKFLTARAEGGAAQYADIRQEGEPGEFRTYTIGLSESARGAQTIENYLDVYFEANITGSHVSQQVRIDLTGRPTLEVKEKNLTLMSGGVVGEIHAIIKDPGEADWHLDRKLVNMTVAEFDGENEEDPANSFLVKIKPGELPAGDLRPREGTLNLVGKATHPKTGEEIETDAIDIPIVVGQQGLMISPNPVKMKLDPKDAAPAEFGVRVIVFDESSKTFKALPAAAQALEMEDWLDGDGKGGANAFKGANVELKFTGRMEGSGLDTKAVWTAKPGLLIPTAMGLDARRVLRAPGDFGEAESLFEVTHTFIAPSDPAALMDQSIRREQENCRKTLKYLEKDTPLKRDFIDKVENHAKELGPDGLYKMRHEIWEAAQKSLLEDAASYLWWADRFENCAQAFDIVNYVCGVILGGLAGVALPFPGSGILVGQLYNAIPDAVQWTLVDGKPAADWVTKWKKDFLDSLGGFAFDLGMAFVWDTETVFLRALKETKGDVQKAVLITAGLYYEIRFIKYQVTSKAGGEPYSLKEAVWLSLKDTGEEIAQTLIGKWAKGRDPHDLSKPKPAEPGAGGTPPPPPDGPTPHPTDGSAPPPPDGPTPHPTDGSAPPPPDGPTPHPTDGSAPPPPDGPTPHPTDGSAPPPPDGPTPHPTDGDDGPTPHPTDGDDGTTPHPTDGDDGTTPHPTDGDDGTTPHPTDGDDGTTPHPTDGDDGPTPHPTDGDDGTTPHPTDGDDGTTPHPTDGDDGPTPHPTDGDDGPTPHPTDGDDGTTTTGDVPPVVPPVKGGTDTPDGPGGRKGDGTEPPSKGGGDDDGGGQKGSGDQPPPSGPPKKVVEDVRQTMDDQGGKLTQDQVTELMKDPQKMRSIKNGDDPAVKKEVDRIRDQIVNDSVDAAKRSAAEEIVDRNGGQKLTPQARERAIQRVMKDIKVDDFRTPGDKPSFNTDKDLRLTYNGKEIPVKVYKGNADAAFAQKTGFTLDKVADAHPNDPNVSKHLDTLTDPHSSPEAKQKALESLQETWRRDHNVEFTDKDSPVSCKDFSDQHGGPPNIVKVKNGEGRLQDPKGLGDMEAHKITSEGHPSEQAAQAHKAVHTMEQVHQGLTKHGDNPPPVPPNIARVTQELNRLKNSTGFDERFTPGQQAKFNDFLAKNGFPGGMNDFAGALGKYLGSLPGGG